MAVDNIEIKNMFIDKSIKIDRSYMLGKTEPSVDVLKYALKEHEAMKPYFQLLSDYYDGKHNILNREKDDGIDLVDVVVNNAKYVTDVTTGFAFGNPIGYAPQAVDDKEKVQDITELTNALDKMNIKMHDREMGKDLSVYGVAYEVQYYVEETKRRVDGKIISSIVPKIACIDPRGMFVVKDTTIDAEPLFACRVVKVKGLNEDDEGIRLEVYTPDEVIVYKAKDIELEDLQEIDRKPHFYGEVPVVEYRNNEERQGDFEQALTIIDAMNMLMTDRINDKQAFVKAVLVFYGFSIEEEDEDGNKQIKVGPNYALEAPADARVEYLTKTLDEADTQVLFDALEDALHKVTFVPNLNDEKFGGTISGEAMKYKLFGLLQLLVIKIGYFETGVRQRLRLLTNFLATKQIFVDPDAIKLSFKANLPVNKKEIIEMINLSRDFIPLLISLGWLDDVDNPADIVKMLDEQKEKEISVNQRAFGMSHDNLDEEPDEKEEKEDD